MSSQNQRRFGLPLSVGVVAVALCLVVEAFSADVSQGWRSSSDHWAFQPVIRPLVPVIAATSQPANPIDSFVLSRLEREQLAPSPEADRPTLLRRVSLDLTGLPPTPEEALAFLADSAPGAYERLVDRLLASPHYGERWARHWLDAARYADSAGHEFDTKRPIWKYRDWVIQAFNQDKPYDEFLIEQLAGDLLAAPTVDQLTATGFSCNALQEYGDIEETTIDRVNAFGTAYLGLTVSCAQCHDHPFDPISQEEYFGLYAFLNQAEDTELELDSADIVSHRDALKRQVQQLKLELESYKSGPDRDPVVWAARLTSDEVRSLHTDVREAVLKIAVDRTADELETLRGAHAQAVARFDHDLAQRFESWEDRLSEERRKALSPGTLAYLAIPRDRRPAGRPDSVMTEFWNQDTGFQKRQAVIEQLEAGIPEVLATLVLRQRIGNPETHVFVGGDSHSLGDKVTPHTPQALPPLSSDSPSPNRLDLARWVASREHPLTARVAVNRSWQAFFGTGIVETSENLGTQSSEPSHPELLDWLAVELMENRWRLKHLHRLIVTSMTYRQSSHARRDLAERDPQNRLLARQNRLRLEGEIIRDEALACGGLLDRSIGGPSVFPHQVAGIMDGRADAAKWIVSEGSDRYRRGLYTHYWRLTPHPFARQFDAPDASESCARRPRSNTPLQSLTLLNDPWFTEAAVAMAKRSFAVEPQRNDARRLDWMFKTCLVRGASAEEQEVLFELLAEQRSAFEVDSQRAIDLVGHMASLDEAQETAAWTSLARTLLNVDEFITRE